MSLMDLHYFPLWEGEVHDVLQECFGDLQSIFAFYCKVITHSNPRLLRDSDPAESAIAVLGLQHSLQHSCNTTQAAALCNSHVRPPLGSPSAARTLRRRRSR